MSRKTKLVCGILLAIALGVGALGIWQWNNISAALSFLRFSKEELEQQLEQKEQDIKDAVPEITIRDITQEEKDALRDGTLTQEELIDSIIKPQPPVEQKPEEPVPDVPAVEPAPVKPTTPEEPTKPAPTPEPTPPEQSEYERQLAAIIAEVYVLREQFLIKLDELLAEAKAVYLKLTPEQRTKTNMVPLVADYMARGTQLEEECDTKIVEILNRLEILVQENHGDTKLSQKIFDAYVDEKSIKKAWYMAELKEKGLV